MAQVLESCRIVALAEKFWQEVESKQKWNGAYKTTECSAWWVLQKKKVRCKEYHRKKVTHRNEFLLCIFLLLLLEKQASKVFTLSLQLHWWLNTKSTRTHQSRHTHTIKRAHTHTLSLESFCMFSFVHCHCLLPLHALYKVQRARYIPKCLLS